MAWKKQRRQRQARDCTNWSIGSDLFVTLIVEWKDQVFS
jgi:hypothetical protein